MLHPGDSFLAAIGTPRVVRQVPDSTSAALVIECSYPPGLAPAAFHSHPGADESCIVLSGEMSVTVGWHGTPRLYRAGESWHVPAGVPHQVNNVSDEIGTYNWSTAPGDVMQSYAAMELLLPNNAKLAVGRLLRLAEDLWRGVESLTEDVGGTEQVLIAAAFLDAHPEAMRSVLPEEIHTLALAALANYATSQGLSLPALTDDAIRAALLDPPTREESPVE